MSKRPATFRLRTIGAAAAIGALVVGAGCGGDTQPQQSGEPNYYEWPIQIEASDTDGEPVPGVPVLLDDQLVGFTDADGSFEGLLEDTPLEDDPEGGQRRKSVHLEVESPEGYRLADGEQATTSELVLTRSVTDEEKLIPVRLRLSPPPSFESTLEQYLVWVDLECDEDLDDEYCQDVPVRLDGETQTHTDSRGIAHFTWQTRPGSSAEVTVPVSSQLNGDDEDDGPETIEPADPVWQLETDTDAAVYRLSEEFTDPDAEPEPTWTPPPTTGSTGGSSDTDPDPDPDDDDNGDSGIIQLR